VLGHNKTAFLSQKNLLLPNNSNILVPSNTKQLTNSADEELEDVSSLQLGPKPNRKSKWTKRESQHKIDSTLYTLKNESETSIWKDVDDAASVTSVRRIEAQQHWIAKLFHVDPVKRHLCFTISKVRARKEIVRQLRKWRKFGIRDIEVDKERSIVFARVDKENCKPPPLSTRHPADTDCQVIAIGVKELTFAVEIMTVIEHGKRGRLAIARFTQERGAASTLNKLVDTLDTIFKARELLVTDKLKRAMIIKTLKTLKA